MNISSGRFAQPRRRRRPWLVCIPIFLTLALIAGFLAVGVPLLRQAMDPYGDKILDGIRVGEIDLSGMTKKQAMQALEAPSLRQLTLTLSGRELVLEDCGIRVETKALAQAAYEIGRSREAASLKLNLAPYLSVEEATLRGALETAARELAQGGTDTTWALEGQLPELSEESFQPDTPLPALTVTLGVRAYRLDTEAAFQQVLSALQLGSLTAALDGCAAAEGGEVPQAQAILTQVCREPVDASVNRADGQLIPGSYGVGADAEALEQALSSAVPGQTVRVELEALAPRVLGREAYFQDVLGFCQTPHNISEKRDNNLRLACKALNGVVLEPGETLSYNATLGERTKEAGYQAAPAYSGVDLVDTLGGGICQVSSTLYLCSLYAGLETVERVSHGFPASYMPVALDATVSWGAPDLKLRNNLDYPVKIVAEERDEFVRVWIMGIESRDYYVRMAFSSSSDGYGRSYICKYDRQTGESLSREHCAFSSYLSDNLSAAGEIGSDEIYRNGNVQKGPVCEPSAETLEEALHYQKPNTRGQE